MGARLTVEFRDPERSVTEMYDDVRAAGEAVTEIAAEMGGEVSPGLGIDARSGHLLCDRPTNAPVRISEVVGTFRIEEI